MSDISNTNTEVVVKWKLPTSVRVLPLWLTVESQKSFLVDQHDQAGVCAYK